MTYQKVAKKIFSKLLSFKSNLNFLFIFNFLISFFIFDLAKADSNNATLKSNTELAIDFLDSRGELEELNLDSETIELILENAKNRTEIDIDYLDPKNELEDYIVDTGDSLLIEFKNKPRGLGAIELDYDPENISYLNPRNDLRNYKLDEGDTLSINFFKTPELNVNQRIDQEGEIYLSRLKSTYVRGLNIYQLKVNLQYQQYNLLIHF